MHYLINHKFIVTFVIFLWEFGHLQSTPTHCDIRMWYVNLVTNDVFNIEMNEDQLVLKNSIESLIKEASKSKESGKIECHVLQKYNDMLHKVFGYTQSSSAMDNLLTDKTKENDVKQELGSNSEEKSEKSIPQESNQKSTGTESKEINNTALNGDDSVKEIMNKVNANEKLNKNPTIRKTEDEVERDKSILVNDSNKHVGLDKKIAEANIARSDETSAKKENLVDRQKDIRPKNGKNGYNVDEFSKDKVSQKSKLPESSQTYAKNNDGGKSNKDVVNTEISSHGSQISADESEIISEGKDISKSQTEEKPVIKTHLDDMKINEVDLDINAESVKRSPINQLPVAGASEFIVTGDDNVEDSTETDETELSDDNYVLDAEQTHNKPEESKLIQNADEDQDFLEQDVHILYDSSVESSQSRSKFEDKATKSKFKSLPFGVCWAAACIRSDIFINYVSNNCTHRSNKDKLLKKEIVDEERTFFKICAPGKFCSSVCYFTHSDKYCIAGEEFGRMNGTIRDKNTKANATGNIKMNSNNATVTDSKKQTEVHIKDSVIDNSVDHSNEISLRENRNSAVPDQQSIKPNSAEKEFEGEFQSINTMEKKDLLSLPIERLEKIVTQRTSEYGQKIQSLELMIIKLENLVLVEKLHKQNHSSTITRLENMILKLENDLLRMYKNYETLKEETEQVNKKQNKYLEIAQMQQQNMTKYPELPDQRVENQEILTKHKLLIDELQQTINSQTASLNHMRVKSEYLEEQNRILHEMISNQTSFMTHIIQSVKDLTEQNSKQMQEVKGLKETLGNLQSNAKFLELSKISHLFKGSSKFIKDLDSLTSDETLRLDQIDMEIGYTMDSDNTAQPFHLRWCKHSTLTNNSCLYQSVMNLSNCIPYRNIFWSNCSQSLKKDNKEDTEEITDNIVLPTISNGQDNKNEIHDTSEGSESDNNKVELPEIVTLKSRHDCSPVSNDKDKRSKRPTVSITDDIQTESSTISDDKDDKADFYIGSGSKKGNSTDKTLIKPISKCITDKWISLENIFKFKSQTTTMQQIFTTGTEAMDPHANDISASENRSVSVDNMSSVSKAEDKQNNTMPDKNTANIETNRQHKTIKQTESSNDEGVRIQKEIKELPALNKEHETDNKKQSTVHPDTISGREKTSTEKSNNVESDSKQTDSIKFDNTKDKDLIQSETLLTEPLDVNIPSKSQQSDNARITLKQTDVKEADPPTDKIKKSEFQEEAAKQTDSNKPNTKMPNIDQAEINQQNKATKSESKEVDAKEKYLNSNNRPLGESQSDDKRQHYDNGAGIRENDLKQSETKVADFQESQDSKSDFQNPDTTQPGSVNTDTKVTDQKIDIKINDFNNADNKQASERKQINSDQDKAQQNSFKHGDSKNNDSVKVFDEKTQIKKNTSEIHLNPSQINESREIRNLTEEKIIQKKDIPDKKKTGGRKKPKYLETEKQTEPKDCYDIYTSGKLKDGVYKIKPVASSQMIQVYCDMKQGGWTILQKRDDGTTNFFQDWDSYKKGFGGVYGEHWLGNDNIHLLTNQDYYILRVELKDWNKNKRFALYDYFLVDDEKEGYRLHIDGYSGDAGDGLSKHNGNKFSTKDVDNDKVVKEFGGSCANRFHGAGWYYKCYASNLNGKYYRSGKIPEKLFDGITWKPWTGPNYSLKTVQMKIQRASVNN